MDKIKTTMTRAKEPQTKPLTEEQKQAISQAKKEREKTVKAGKIVTK